MSERPGGAPFINNMPQSVIARFEASQQRTAASDEAKKTQHFYPAKGGGKYHRAPANYGSHVADCRSTIELDKSAGPITVGPDQDRSKVHPMVCRKCLDR